MHHGGRTIAKCAPMPIGLARHVVYVRGRELCVDTELTTHALYSTNEWVFVGFFKHMQPLLRDRSAAADDWKRSHSEKEKLRRLTAEESVRLEKVSLLSI
jgi:hypothetical protein